jgi:hypothetical protein
MTSGRNGHISTLTGLELAKYVLKRLVDNHDSVERVAEDFDNDVQFILGIVDFLKEIQWMEQNLTSGIYQITEKGKMKAEVSKMGLRI